MRSAICVDACNAIRAWMWQGLKWEVLKYEDLSVMLEMMHAMQICKILTMFGLRCNMPKCKGLNANNAKLEK